MRGLRRIRSILSRRRADREAQRRLLTERLLALLERLGNRLDGETYRWAGESAGQTEWELAIDVIREASLRGELVLTAEEERELSEIQSSRHVNQQFVSSATRGQRCRRR
jgi:hypothetical protein